MHISIEKQSNNKLETRQLLEDLLINNFFCFDLPYLGLEEIANALSVGEETVVCSEGSVIHFFKALPNVRNFIAGVCFLSSFFKKTVGKLKSQTLLHIFSQIFATLLHISNSICPARSIVRWHLGIL